MPNSRKPLARTDRLVLQELPDELLVYDVAADKAHCLNSTSAAVWKACDGDKTIEELSALFETAPGSSHGEGVVLLALEQFQDSGLLQNPVDLGPAYSRRDVVRRIGIAVALPVVASLAMPANLMAASCACVNPGSCLTQSTCPSTQNCNRSGVCAP